LKTLALVSSVTSRHLDFSLAGDGCTFSLEPDLED